MKGKRVLVIGSIIFLIFTAASLTFSGSIYAKEPYKIEIYTYKVGSFTYAMGVALADFINKESTWLRATAIEAAGASVTARIVATEPATRKKIMGFMTRWEAETGYPPFKEPYRGIRDLAVIGFVVNGLVTLDSNIKTVHDLSGKRVGLGTSPSVARVGAPKRAILKAGVKNVRFSEHGFLDGVRALSDGLIDALLSGAFLVNAEKRKFGPNPAFAELIATKNAYYTSFDKAAYNAAINEIGSELLYAYTVPPGGMPKQTEPWITQGGPIMWSCDREMPEDVVYEIVRIMAKNAANFKKYHPLGRTITPENMAKMGDERTVHPGALKFYREKGIKIGRF